MKRSGARLRELDVLRFVAALAVMFHHYVGDIGGWGVANHHNMPGLAPVTHFGNLGVDLFFLISGFVILMSSWGRGVGDFALSRVVRIFPAYWFSVCLAFVLFLATGVSQLQQTLAGPGPLRSFLPNLTMLQYGIGADSMEDVYWTLWIELHFYVLIGLLIWRGVTYQRCVLFMGGWLLLGVFAQESNFGILQSFMFPTWAPFFIAGMGFYLIYRFGPNLLLGLLIGACWTLSVYYRVTIVNTELVWPGVWQNVVTVVDTCIFLVMALVALRKLTWLRWRGLTVLGGMTYPLYLLHETVSRPLIHWLAPRHGRWALLGLCVAVALVTAYAVYRFVEQPAQRWLKPRLKRAWEQIRAGGVSPETPDLVLESLREPALREGVPR